MVNLNPSPIKEKTMRKSQSQQSGELFANDAKRLGFASFTIFWKRSNTWGLCPSAHYQGRRMAHASGCGYCKQSAVLDEVMRFLVPSIRHTGGAGERPTIEAAKEQGWILSCDYNGRTEEGWSVKKMEGGAQ
jgi:hypothetical protein